MRFNHAKKMSTSLMAGGMLALLLSGSAIADVIRGPITFGPGTRIKLDCPSVPNPSNMVLSDVQGFGHVSHPVKFKLLYKSTLYATPVDVPGSEMITKDYIQSLNAFLGNFPGPGYYSLVMRNTNSFSITLPANEQIGIICR